MANSEMPKYGVLMEHLRAIAFIFIGCFSASGTFAQMPADTYPDGISKVTDLPAQTWANTHPNCALCLLGLPTVQSGSGWGPGFVASLKAGVECLNLSKGERSSRTIARKVAGTRRSHLGRIT